MSLHTNPPRYLPERVLPAYAFLPGRTPRPQASAANLDGLRVTETNWRTHEEYLWGVDLYNCGFTWEAHEAWEGLWRIAAQDSLVRTFLQGLIQCAAASVKSAIGDTAAAARIATRALERLTRVHSEQGPVYLGVDVASFGVAFERYALTVPPAPALRPSLCLNTIDE